MPKQTRKKGSGKGGEMENPQINEKSTRKIKSTGKQTMRCHPSVLNKTVNANSCLTSSVLSKIKQKYNEKHPEKPLLAKSPKKLYYEISQRFAESCKEEKCWIRQLLQENELKHLYRPTSPADWKKNPVEWLSNFDIEDVMNQYEQTYPEFEFLGPVPIDFDKRSVKSDNSTCVSRDVCSFHLAEKLKKGKTKIGIVFNLSPSTSSGSHWVSLYVHLPNILPRTKSKPTGGKKENESSDWNEHTAYCFFFDSAGESAPKEVEELVKRLQEEWKTNQTINTGNTEMMYDCNHRTGADHQQGNTECGVYSLFFLITMLTGKCAGGVMESENCALSLNTEQEKVLYFQGKTINSHGEKIMIPDDFMIKLRKHYFNPPP